MSEIPESENPVLRSLFPETLNRGFDEKANERLIWRLNYLEKTIEERKIILKNGNIASLESELVIDLHQVQDLIDTFREFLTLISRKEQGLISPPQSSANDTGTPALP